MSRSNFAGERCSHASRIAGKSDAPEDKKFYQTVSFLRMLYLEGKRAERSKRPGLLVLLNVEGLINQGNHRVKKKLSEALFPCVRETDLMGWYQPDKVLSILYTEIGNLETTIQKLLRKVQDHLFAGLDCEEVQMIKISHSIFPPAGLEREMEWSPCIPDFGAEIKSSD